MKLRGENIVLSTDRTKNYITYEKNQFKLISLSSTIQGSRGANSNVFILRDPQEIYEDRAIKICKSAKESGRPKDIGRLRRFGREIEALRITKKKYFVVEYFFDGEIQINKRTYRYYVMEKGSSDLKEYIQNNILTIDDKILLCKQVLQALYELHELGIYHRDIKPDNYFFIGDTWKIGDLGLIRYRHEDHSVDDPNDFIGPRGWVSPETMNKFLTFERDMEFSFDCNIDNISDVFQLGNLFWFIFQGNVPIGRIRRKDFRLKYDDIYSVLICMINHSKEKRPQIEILRKELTRIFDKIAA